MSQVAVSEYFEEACQFFSVAEDVRDGLAHGALGQVQRLLVRASDPSVERRSHDRFHLDQHPAAPNQPRIAQPHDAGQVSHQSRDNCDRRRIAVRV